jgi:hypothetical protein
LAKSQTDDGIAIVYAELKARFASLSPAETMCDGPLPTPEETEELRRQLLDMLLRAICSDTARCSDQRCRRSGRCRWRARLAAARRGPRSKSRR